MILNPSALRRVYDNEFRTAADKNSVTLAEVIGAVTDNVWREVKAKQAASSFRRNLQREHVDRLIFLSLMDSNTASQRTISTLATQHLRKINKWAAAAEGNKLDDYAEAHLADVRERIAKTLEATYVIER